MAHMPDDWDSKREAAVRKVTVGGFILVIGLLFTLGSILAFSARSTGAGLIIIAWGAIVFGGLQLARGLSELKVGSRRALTNFVASVVVVVVFLLLWQAIERFKARHNQAAEQQTTAAEVERLTEAGVAFGYGNGIAIQGAQYSGDSDVRLPVCAAKCVQDERCSAYSFNLTLKFCTYFLSVIDLQASSDYFSNKVR